VPDQEKPEKAKYNDANLITFVELKPFMFATLFHNEIIIGILNSALFPAALCCYYMNLFFYASFLLKASF